MLFNNLFSGLRFEDFFQYTEQRNNIGHRFKLFKLRSNTKMMLLFFFSEL